jgi:hypothetical protein
MKALEDEGLNVHSSGGMVGFTIDIVTESSRSKEAT